ncbi:MAG: efflux RND transporter periplasmic adaptor subunit [Myxococcales bacterium]
MRGWILAMAAAGCAAQATGRGEGAVSQEPTTVRLVATRAENAPRFLAGTVSASSHATISTRISATVAQVFVREGDTVARGVPLVRLAAADLRSQLAAAQTGLQAAEAAERRTRLLVQGGYSPPSNLDVAQAQRAQAAGQVAALREALTYAEVKAPFAGVVLAKLVSPGDLVAPGQPMVELSGDALEIVARASEDESRAQQTGLRRPVESGAGRGEAELTALSPGGDPVSHRSIVRARIVGPTAGLRSGDFARLRIPSAPGDPMRLLVPRTAVVERGDLTGVFLPEGGRARLRWISPGDATTDAVSIRAGLRAGDQVIDAPGALRDGEPVEVAHAR